MKTLNYRRKRALGQELITKYMNGIKEQGVEKLREKRHLELSTSTRENM
jgi:hypothetical protein